MYVTFTHVTQILGIELDLVSSFIERHIEWTQFLRVKSFEIPNQIQSKGEMLELQDGLKFKILPCTYFQLRHFVNNDQNIPFEKRV